MEPLNKDFIKQFKLPTSAMNGWYTINKPFAEYLLSLNVKNYRNVNKNKVNSWIEDMKSGNWKKNGETIVINKEGFAQDGQHRLHAVVKSNAKIVSYIVFDADVTNVYDLNLVRSVNTMFRANKISESAFHAAIGKIMLNGGTMTIPRGTVVTYDYVNKHLDDFKKAENIVCTGYGRGKGVAKKAACATIVYCLLRTGEISEAKMRSFFRVMNTGTKNGYAKNASPAKELRKQFLDMRGGGRALQKKQLEITYKALRDFNLNIARIGGYDDDVNDAVRLIKYVGEMDKINYPDAA